MDKKCSKCGEIKDDVLFSKNSPWCKPCKKKWRREYYLKNGGSIKEANRLYRTNNPEKVKQTKKMWSENNKEKETNNKKRHYNINRDKYLSLSKNNYYNNRDARLLAQSTYNKSEAGKVADAKRRAKKRGLGFNPINSWFAGAAFHHLYINNKGDIDTHIGIWIPSALHNSVWHSIKKMKNVDKINSLSVDWYLKNTPPDEINEVVFSFYTGIHYNWHRNF